MGVPYMGVGWPAMIDYCWWFQFDLLVNDRMCSLDVDSYWIVLPYW